MPMDYEHPAAIDQTMNGMLLHSDVAIGAVKFGEQIIVITGDVNGPRAFTRFPKNLLNNVVMLLRPINTAPQLPDVDQVPSHKECFDFELERKILQSAPMRPTSPKLQL